MMKLGYTLLLFAAILSLQCSTRPPSFYMVARHPELLDVKSSRLQLVIRNSGGASYSNEFLAWRAGRAVICPARTHSTRLIDEGGQAVTGPLV